MLTSINLSAKSAHYWREHRESLRGYISRHCAKLSRLKPVRDHAITYNHKGRYYEKISIRFSPAEYNALRYYSHALRVSVSRILDAMIRSFFAKPPESNLFQRPWKYDFIYEIKPGCLFKLTEAWSMVPDTPEKLVA